jgi:hypothetical protein
MSKTVSQIYTEYKIMPSLQMHMLRVAAVASMICDNFTEPISKEDIIIACLLHDMGNIIKSNLNIFKEFYEPEGIEYWQAVKDEYVTKYGDDAHMANLRIMKELGVSERIIFLADQDQFSLICSHFENSDMDVKITHYSDGRVAPHGVLSYQGRMDEAKKRYGNKLRLEEERNRLVKCGLGIEQQIFAKCNIKPEDITDASVAPIIEELKGFVIK